MGLCSLNVATNVETINMLKLKQHYVDYSCMSVGSSSVQMPMAWLSLYTCCSRRCWTKKHLLNYAHFKLSCVERHVAQGSVVLVLLHRDVVWAPSLLWSLLITLRRSLPCCLPCRLAHDTCSLHRSAVGGAHLLTAPSAMLPVLRIPSTSLVSSHQNIGIVVLLQGEDATCWGPSWFWSLLPLARIPVVECHRTEWLVEAYRWDVVGSHLQLLTNSQERCTSKWSCLTSWACWRCRGTLVPCWVPTNVEWAVLLTQKWLHKKGWIHDCLSTNGVDIIMRHKTCWPSRWEGSCWNKSSCEKEIILTKSMMLIQIVEIDHHVWIPKQRSCWNTGWNETREMFINVCWWHRSWLKRVRVCFCVCIVCSRSCARVRIVH